MYKLLNTLAFCMFLFGGVLAYAYVFDVEPLSAEKVYSLEKDVFNHSDAGMYGDFPAFSDWLAEQDQRENRMSDYLYQLGLQVGRDYAEIWEWGTPVDASIPMSAEQWQCAYGRD